MKVKRAIWVAFLVVAVLYGISHFMVSRKEGFETVWNDGQEVTQAMLKARGSCANKQGLIAFEKPTGGRPSLFCKCSSDKHALDPNSPGRGCKLKTGQVCNVDQDCITSKCARMGRGKNAPRSCQP